MELPIDIVSGDKDPVACHLVSTQDGEIVLVCQVERRVRCLKEIVTGIWIGNPEDFLGEFLFSPSFRKITLETCESLVLEVKKRNLKYLVIYLPDHERYVIKKFI